LPIFSRCFLHNRARRLGYNNGVKYCGKWVARTDGTDRQTTDGTAMLVAERNVTFWLHQEFRYKYTNWERAYPQDLCMSLTCYSVFSGPSSAVRPCMSVMKTKPERSISPVTTEHYTNLTSTCAASRSFRTLHWGNIRVSNTKYVQILIWRPLRRGVRQQLL